MFDITEGKGFHITFENLWTVSVQFGVGNYCDNKSSIHKDIANSLYAGPSRFAELAVFSTNSSDEDVWEKGSPHGWLSANDVAKHIARVARKKPLLAL